MRTRRQLQPVRKQVPSPSKTREGAILGLVLVTMVILSFLGIGLINLSLASAMEAGRTVSTIQSFWNAEAGLEQAKAIAQKRRRPAEMISLPGSPSGKLTGTNSVSGTTVSGSYSVDVYVDPAWTNASSSLKRYLIRSRGQAPNGKEQTVTVSALIESFASYMHAAHLESHPVWGKLYFWTGDVIDGPVYSNDELNILDVPGPLFKDIVNSASNRVHYLWGATSNVFTKGINLGMPPIDISGQFSSGHISEVKDDADSGGLSLTGDYQLDFQSDGSLVYTDRGTGVTNMTYLSSLNGAIYVNGDAYVNGVLNGKVTVAAQDSIYISNQIVYASAVSPNPWQTNFNANTVTDMMGLIASNQVQILGTSNVTIHAAVMVTADGGGLNAFAYNQNISKPFIYLYGSCAQYRSGITGIATTPPQGFGCDWKYDQRYKVDAPPNFPYSNYVFGQWRHTGI